MPGNDIKYKNGTTGELVRVRNDAWDSCKTKEDDILVINHYKYSAKNIAYNIQKELMFTS